MHHHQTPARPTDPARAAHCAPRAARQRAAACVLVLAAALLAACGERRARPNLILISIDSLRADHLGCYGYPKDTSANLDRLARDGTRFQALISESSWTLPTHMTMLTGLSTGVHGVATDTSQLAPTAKTLASILAARGYRTRGLWSGTYLHPHFGFDRGFQPGDYEGVIGELVYDLPGFDESQPRFARKRMDDMQNAISAVTSPAVIDKAIDFVDQVGEQPFFLFLHLFDVHFDYNPPDAYWRRFDADYQGSLDIGNLPFNDAIHAGMDPRELQHLIARYDGEIAFVDHHIGRLLDALTRLGLDARTVVAVTADHGEEFFEHGNKGHQKTLFDEVTHVPWIVRQPQRIAAGRVAAEQVRQVDIAPTLLGLLDVTPPREMMGEDLAPLLLGQRSEAHDLIAVSRLAGRIGQVAAMRMPRWKVVHDQPRGGRTTINYYDLQQDPGEQAPIPATDPRTRDAMLKLAEFSRTEDALRRLLGSADGGEVEVPPDIQKQLDQLGY